MRPPPVRITAVGAATSIGVGARQTTASLRAGLSRFRQRWAGVDHPRSTVAFASDELLPYPWQARLLALTGLALRDLMADRADDPRPVVLLLGGPDRREFDAELDEHTWWTTLHQAWPVDARRSRLIRSGRAAVFEALEAGRALLAEDPRALVVCGGVDSYADPRRIAHEHERGRTLGAGPGDGRVLGEGAGLLLLRPGDPRQRGEIELVELGLHEDPGHRFGSEPARGEGLAEALERLRTRSAASPGPFASCWAGIAGEHHDAKLWSTASLRHQDVLGERTKLEHPADRVGDAGAGLGGLLLVDAYVQLQARRRPGPALVWAGSDHGLCGTAWLRTAHESET